MDRNELKLIVMGRLDACQELLKTKGAAYTGSVDVLANFKRNANALGLSKYQVWAVYANKHLDAVNTAIKGVTSEQPIPRDKSEGLPGRITDVINYFLLLEALLSEDENEPKHNDRTSDTGRGTAT